ncbi:vacuolar protein sorting/targeting protein 10 [Westerdykella ornata]|uniref:Vacuolar protein sorting/targeting protein 10 n=1 Tax=Westerdykella ornata TaxID=318751 RepID=A0A6A6JLL9_WESOR|nr:vacuolar protein sorting/targeting protein 10 [Westerdykella ornata]KAF2277402.1 vacuolar protein sorting/targeting protein 10 [Westerdykella ornata]
MKFAKGILLPALLALASTAFGKKDEPVVEVRTFDNELVNLFYFEDSEVALATEFETGVVHRTEDAGKEWVKLDFEAGVIIKNPFDKQVAVAFGNTKHYITYDRGKSWREFTTKYRPSWSIPVSFHATDNKKLLYHGEEDIMSGIGATYYTEDGFKSKPKLLRDDRRMCIWAKGTDRFLLDNDKSDKYDNRVLCITTGKFSHRSKDFRLLISDKYFDDGDEHEPVMSSGRTVSGMANMASVKGYIVAAAKSDHSNELALYVTDDTDVWHRAEFGEGKIEENAYTILESTNYSIQVDVMTSSHAYIGSLYTSNSNGTYFTKNVENTNRNQDGYVDFEKISNIQGIVMVNLVDNADEVKNPLTPKKLRSAISFDDGRTFQSLKVKGSDKDLHLHSVTNLRNSGRVFSTPAPGVVMGVGNTGKHLGKYEDGDLWVSDDAGVTWQLALESAHIYEFGNQGSVLVAVYDEGETDKIMYSLKHGREDSWKKIELDFKIRARELTTTPDSTSLKFILYGTRAKKGGGREFVTVHLDFAGLHEDKCKDKDFEEWAARVDKDGKPTCVMGHKQFFRRRKWDADCFVDEDFQEPLPRFEPCDCDEVLDYECDFNFTPHGSGKDKECKPSAALQLPKGACKGDEKTYKGPSGWRKIPGNQCKGKTKKDEEVERDCKESSKPPASGKITHAKETFKGSNFREYYYLERGSQSKDSDETVVMLTSEREAWVTHDHGKKWKRAVDDDIVAIYPHQYNNDYVYLLTGTEKVYYSKDRLMRDSTHDFKAPHMPNTQMLQIMQFHSGSEESDWLIWVGGEDCKRPSDPKCHTVASVSQNNGQEWKRLLPYVKKCAFVWKEEGKVKEKNLVFCEQYTKEEMGNPLELITSTDWFAHKDVKFKSVVEFATMSEFIVVATKGDDGKSLKLDASLDGQTFADAKFPPKLVVDHQTAYTVLDSSTHAIFLHVTVNPRRDQEYGALIKSNSNGTSYVMSLPNVNRNTDGYVDFEKMQGIEGVALANVVANVDAVNGGSKKEKRTLITHNDGVDWQPLQAPAKDSENKPYDCDVRDKDVCSLHVHGYTERGDPRETFSSPTAVGIMLGVGNVGRSLGTFGEASTFMTTDAGVTWKEVKKGNYAWEFGDQGSIIVLVHRGKDTKDLYYSLDSGETWNSYQFNEHAIQVDAISTVPSDTSLNFLLWGRDARELVTINVDFSGLEEFQEKCDLKEEDATSGDYDLWSPQHPMQGDLDDPECLFGHVAQYHRKKRGVKCRNGEIITHLHNIARNCTCTRRDYECDYNYERQPGGECKLIPGLNPPDPQEVCKEKGVKEYWTVTGYRKIPISTCEGREMDRIESKPCPGYEEEYRKKHGISGFGIFMAVVIPFVAAGGIGYYVWRNWDGKFGRIRLGETSYSESPWVSWPVAAISGLVALVAAIPLVVTSVWRAVSSRFGGGYGYVGQRYTSRSSFARGRGNYAVVDEDEGELLGDESDEDV